MKTEEKNKTGLKTWKRVILLAVMAITSNTALAVDQPQAYWYQNYSGGYNYNHRDWPTLRVVLHYAPGGANSYGGAKLIDSSTNSAAGGTVFTNGGQSGRYGPIAGPGPTSVTYHGYVDVFGTPWPASPSGSLPSPTSRSGSLTITDLSGTITQPVTGPFSASYSFDINHTAAAYIPPNQAPNALKIFDTLHIYLQGAVDELTFAELCRGADNKVDKPNGAADPVNTATGTQFFQAPRLTVPGARPATLLFQRNSKYKSYQHNWQKVLYIDENDNLVFIDGQSQQVLYEPESTGSSKFIAHANARATNPGYFQVNSGTSITRHLGMGEREYYVRRQNGTFTLSSAETNGLFTDFTYTPYITIKDRAEGNSITMNYDYTYNQRFSDQSSTRISSCGISGGSWYTTDAAGNTLTISAPTTSSEKTVSGTTTLFENIFVSATDRRISQQKDTFGRSWNFNYATNPTTGELTTTVTNRRSKNTAWLYDEDSNLQSITSPLGNVTSYGYDSAGYRTSITDPAGKTSSFVYGSYGMLTQTTDPRGGVTDITYDAALNITDVADREGYITSYGYDGSNRLTSIENALSETTTLTLNTKGQITAILDPAGNTSTNTYTSGRKTAQTDREGRTSTFTYYTTGFLKEAIDPASNKITFTYDGMGRPLTIVTPRSGTTTLTYNFRGQPLSLKNALNQQWNKEYNGNGYLTKVTNPDSTFSTLGYDYEDNLTSTTDELGKTSTLTYDDDDRFTGGSDADGVAWSQTLEARGLPTATKNDAGTTVSTATYDDNGNLASLTDSGTNTWAFAYDLRDLPTITTRPDTKTDEITYDALGRISAYEDFGGITASQGFNSIGRRISLTNPANDDHTWTLDKDGLVMGETTYGGKITTLTRNTRGLPATLTEPGSRNSTLTYDADGNIATISDAVGDITFTNDLLGRTTSTSEIRGSFTHNMTTAYNWRGQPTSFTDWHGNTIAYEYNNRGDLTKITYPGSKDVVYTYTDAGRMASVTDWNSRTTSYGYDSEGRLSTKTRPNGVVETKTYDLQDRVTKIEDKLGSTIISKIEIEYNSIGKISKETYSPAPTGMLDALGNPATFVEKIYTYDDSGRLTGMVINGTAASSTYTYDTRSNPYASSLTVDNTQIPTLIGGSDSLTVNADNEATSFWGVPITRNAAGEMTLGPTGLAPPSISAKSFTWNSRGQLTNFGRVYDSNGELVEDTNFTYTVDAYGNRLISDNGSVQKYHVYGADGLEYSVAGTSEEWLHNDVRGTVTATTDETGTVTGRWWYGPYGELVHEEGTSTNPFLFLGKFGCTKETDLGAYKLGVRYYVPTIRQFMSMDALIGSITTPSSLNRYAYCGGDPINQIDPSGLCPNDLAPDGQPKGNIADINSTGFLPWWANALPITGSVARSYLDFEEGRYGWGLANAGLAVSDVFLVKTAAVGIGKLGLTFLGRQTTKGAFNSAYRLEAKALMKQGYTRSQSIEQIRVFQSGNADGFVFHFTNKAGGSGITSSGKLVATKNGVAGPGVYAGTTPTPNLLQKFGSPIGWGVNPGSTVRIPIKMSPALQQITRTPILPRWTKVIGSGQDILLQP